MGWFLTRSKGKKKKKKRGNKSGGWDPARTLAGLKVLGLLAGIVGAGVAWRASEVALVGYAAEHRARPITPADVVLHGTPVWVEGRIAQRLREHVAEVVRADPFDGRGLTDAAAILTMDPWVKEVHQVRRTPRGVEVQADFREPLAVVEAKDGFHIIDTEGVRLAGPAYQEALEPVGLPLIINAGAAPPVELGLPWEGQEVAAGVELVKLLRDEPFAPQITMYDVGQRDVRTGKLSLVLHTDGGAVVWGRPPGDTWAVAEVSTPEKVDRLRRLAETYMGRIDAGGRTVWVHGQQVQTDERPVRRGGAVVEPSYRSSFAGSG